MPRISLKILPLSLRSVSIEEYVQGIKIWVQRNQFFSLVTSQHSSEDLAVGPPTAPLTSKALSGNFCLSTKLVAQARIRHSQKFTFYSHYNDQVVNFVFVYTLFSGIFGIALLDGSAIAIKILVSSPGLAIFRFCPIKQNLLV